MNLPGTASSSPAVKEQEFDSLLRLAALRNAAAAPPAIARAGQYPAASAIAQRAYEIFLRRGAVHGNDLADWLQAEGELRNFSASAGAAAGSYTAAPRA